MKTSMLFAGLALACLTGCETPAPGPAEFPRKPNLVAQERLSSNLARKAFRVKVSARGESEMSFVTEGVRQALCDGGFEVVTSGPAELSVECDTKVVRGSSRGNHVTCRGSVGLSVRRTERWNSVLGRALDGLVGVRRFDAKGGEARTPEESILSLSDRLRDKFAPWVRATCLKATADLELGDVVVTGGNGKLSADYPTVLAATILALPGVYGCSMADSTKGADAVWATVLYDKRQFPEGVLNRLRAIERLHLAR